jgi:hypothetical protein
MLAVHAIKAYRESRSIAPLSCNLDTRWSWFVIMPWSLCPGWGEKGGTGSQWIRFWLDPSSGLKVLKPKNKSFNHARIPPPPEFLLMFSPCTSAVHVLSWLSWLVLPFVLYCTTQNTNIHAPDKIRLRDPSKRVVKVMHLTPLGHWNRQGFEPRIAQAVPQSVNGLRYSYTLNL